jgi:hypothetical protein
MKLKKLFISSLVIGILASTSVMSTNAFSITTNSESGYNEGTHSSIFWTYSKSLGGGATKLKNNTNQARAAQVSTYLYDNNGVYITHSGKEKSSASGTPLAPNSSFNSPIITRSDTKKIVGHGYLYTAQSTVSNPIIESWTVTLDYRN